MIRIGAGFDAFFEAACEDWEKTGVVVIVFVLRPIASSTDLNFPGGSCVLEDDACVFTTTYWGPLEVEEDDEEVAAALTRSGTSGGGIASAEEVGSRGVLFWFLVLFLIGGHVGGFPTFNVLRNAPSWYFGGCLRDWLGAREVGVPGGLEMKGSSSSTFRPFRIDLGLGCAGILACFSFSCFPSAMGCAGAALDSVSEVGGGDGGRAARGGLEAELRCGEPFAVGFSPRLTRFAPCSSCAVPLAFLLLALGWGSSSASSCAGTLYGPRPFRF